MKVGPEYAAALAPRYFDFRKTTIHGGTSEVQMNVIAKRVRCGIFHFVR